jgi:decaprenyl-phosphate phosphoribosyltransferase
MRPLQWVKNLLIFAPLFFAHEFFVEEKFIEVLLGAISFSLLASAVYVFNDLYDKKYDVHHEKKKHRPIASGRVSLTQALGLILVLVTVTVYIVRTYIQEALPIMLGYIVLNVLYTLFLKHVAIVDIATVALFHVIRIFLGGVLAGVLVSDWLILCTFFAGLVMATGKRRSEIQAASSEHTVRPVLRKYSLLTLDYIVLVSSCALLMSYATYTVLGTELQSLVFSNFFAVVGVLRYIAVVQSSTTADTPERLLFSDKIILLSILGWALFLVVVFYFGV